MCPVETGYPSRPGSSVEQSIPEPEESRYSSMYVKRTRTGSRACAQVCATSSYVTSVKSIPTAVRIKVLSAELPGRVPRESGNFAEVWEKYRARCRAAPRCSSLVSRETRFRGMTADKVYVAGKRAVILRLTVKPRVHFISLLFP